jgi:hypothetical protein
MGATYFFGCWWLPAMLTLLDFDVFKLGPISSSSGDDDDGVVRKEAGGGVEHHEATTTTSNASATQSLWTAHTRAAGGLPEQPRPLPQDQSFLPIKPPPQATSMISESIDLDDGMDQVGEAEEIAV